jgi:hypothetical protein
MIAALDTWRARARYAACVSGIVGFGASLWAFMPLDRTPAPLPITEQTQPTTAQAPADLEVRVFSASLWHVPPPVAAPAPAAPPAKPPPFPDIELVGLIEEPDGLAAIVSSATQGILVIRLGDEVGAFAVAGVSLSEVTFTCGNNRRVLKMKEGS